MVSKARMMGDQINEVDMFVNVCARPRASGAALGIWFSVPE